MVELLEVLSISDWISIAGVLVSILLSALIAWIQYRQSEKIASMEKRFEQREETRHREAVNADATNFIVRYGSDRPRLPLCAIAAMHDDTFLYSNEAYRAFCCLPREVQNRILDRSGVNLKVCDIDNLGQRAIDCLLDFYESSFPNNETPFYENAKYVSRSIELYSKVDYKRTINVPNKDDSPWKQHGGRLYHGDIVDVLDAVLETRTIPEQHAIDDLMNRYSFRSLSQVQACQFATTLAYWLMIYSKDTVEELDSIGVGEALMSDDLTLEDMFLAFLYAYYVRYLM